MAYTKFYLKADREAEGMVGEAVNFLMLWNVRADEKSCFTIILADKLYFLKKHSLDCKDMGTKHSTNNMVLTTHK